MEKEQRRAENLTAQDRAFITELVEKHWGVIESKKSDTVTLKEKSKAWEILAEEFNAVSTAKRTAQQLKQVLDNMMRLITIFVKSVTAALSSTVN